MGDEEKEELEGSEEEESGEEEEELEEEESSNDESEEEEEEEESTSALKDQVTQLQARLEELTEMSASKEGEASEEGKPPEYEAQQFLQSDDDLDDVLNSSEGLNKVLNSAVQTAVQHVYKGMPGVIKNNVAQQVQLQETVSEFYSNNPELKKHRSFVGKVSERIMSKNPNWSMDKVLAETSKEASKRLKLKTKAKDKEKNPGFAKAGKGGKKGSTSKLKGQEKEVADMLSSVE